MWEVMTCLGPLRAVWLACISAVDPTPALASVRDWMDSLDGKGGIDGRRGMRLSSTHYGRNRRPASASEAMEPANAQQTAVLDPL